MTTGRGHGIRATLLLIVAVSAPTAAQSPASSPLLPGAWFDGLDATIWLMRADGSDASSLIGEAPSGYPMLAPG